MPAPLMCFDDPNRTDGVIAVEPDSQTVVRPGDRPNTATVISPDGTMVDVRGEVADVHLQIQAAAARSYEGGDVEVANTGVS